MIQAKYFTVQEFLKDIETIVSNTRKYYGDLPKAEEDKSAKAVGKVCTTAGQR